MLNKVLPALRPQVLLSSSELPYPVEALSPDHPSPHVICALGPIITHDILVSLRCLARVPVALHIVGYLRPPAYAILSGLHPGVGEVLRRYLRPVACSFSEQRLTSGQLVQLAKSPALMDACMERYISNLIHDFEKFLNEDCAKVHRVSGAYLSAESGGMVTCSSLPRQLTPPFGQVFLNIPSRMSSFAVNG
jgi:hypothetical protein